MAQWPTGLCMQHGRYPVYYGGISQLGAIIEVAAGLPCVTESVGLSYRPSMRPLKVIQACMYVLVQIMYLYKLILLNKLVVSGLRAHPLQTSASMTMSCVVFK